MAAPTTVKELVLEIRRRLPDWGAMSLKLDANLSDSSTTVSVYSVPQRMPENAVIECELEQMVVTAVAADLTVRRGQNGTTAAAHSSGEWVVVRPRFTNSQIVDSLRQALTELSALEPIEAVSTTNTIVDGTELYSLPANTLVVRRVEMETYVGSGLYREFPEYSVSLGEQKIKVFRSTYYAGRKLRLTYGTDYGWFDYTTSISTIPTKYLAFLKEWTMGDLIEQDEIYKSGVNRQAEGSDSPPPVGRLIAVGAAKKQGAYRHLQIVRPGSRRIQVPSARTYRL